VNRIGFIYATAKHASTAPVLLSTSAQVFRKRRCGWRGNGTSTSVTPIAVIGFDFISARIAVPPSIGKATATRQSAESPWALSTNRPFRRLATRSGRSRCIPGWACGREWSTISRADHRSQVKHDRLLTWCCPSNHEAWRRNPSPLRQSAIISAMSSIQISFCQPFADRV
jgi:hypothetical protein